MYVYDFVTQTSFCCTKIQPKSRIFLTCVMSSENSKTKFESFMQKDFPFFPELITSSMPVSSPATSKFVQQSRTFGSRQRGVHMHFISVHPYQVATFASAGVVNLLKIFTQRCFTLYYRSERGKCTQKKAFGEYK